jgi:polar amino acid transport system permease protein
VACRALAPMIASLGYYRLILDGLRITIELTLAASIVAFCAAFAAGLGALSKSRTVRICAGGYIQFFRGTSCLIQLFWAFYVLPYAGVQLTPMTVGVVVIGLNVGAYSAEVVRGAVLAVPRDQIEAAIALNLSSWQRFRYVTLPQAFVLMLPPFGNNVIELLKLTAIVSLITINELTFQAQMIRSATGNTLIPYLTILGLYFLLSMVLTAPIRWLERRLSWVKGH